MGPRSTHGRKRCRVEVEIEQRVDRCRQAQACLTARCVHRDVARRITASPAADPGCELAVEIRHCIARDATA